MEANGLTEADVTLVNVPTHETPKAFASGDVDAIVAWQPNSGQALKAVPGSKAVFTSKDAQGLIYDVLAVSPDCPYNTNAMTPGRTTINGSNTLSTAAKSRPVCASRTSLAARARWMIYWLQPK